MTSEAGEAIDGDRVRLVGMVSFLFGASQRRGLAGKVLVRLLDDCGVSGPTARSGIARLIRRGSLESVRTGRIAEYRLAGPTLDAYLRIRESTAPTGPPPAPWNGSFHTVMFHVPERDRTFREQLRRGLQLAGYAPLAFGTMISPRPNLEGLELILSRVPAGARVTTGMLTLDGEQARPVAAQAWELDTVAGRILAGIDAIGRRLSPAATPVLPSGETLRQYVYTALGAHLTFIADPWLPPELLPDDWPRQALVDAIGRLRERYAPPVQQYIGQVVAELDEREDPARTGELPG